MRLGVLANAHTFTFIQNMASEVGFFCVFLFSFTACFNFWRQLPCALWYCELVGNCLDKKILMSSHNNGYLKCQNKYTQT